MYLATDCVLKAFVSQMYFDGQKVTNHDIELIYKKWGDWKYLAYWFDIWQGESEEL